MIINHLEINDFSVFKGEFNVYFCPNVNVIIGENGMGKMTFLKTMYFIYKQLSKISTSIASFSSAGWFDYLAGGRQVRRGYQYTVDFKQHFLHLQQTTNLPQTYLVANQFIHHQMISFALSKF
jgi:recombinational DNA repair ATPase RecF